MNNPIKTTLKWYPATQAEVDRLIEAGEWELYSLIVCTKSSNNYPFCLVKEFNEVYYKGKMAKIEWPKEGESEKINNKLINQEPEYCIRLLLSKVRSLEKEIKELRTSHDDLRYHVIFKEIK